MPLNPHTRQCKGKSRRTGKPCRNPAVTGSDYCRLHGGGALGNRSRTGMPKPPGSGGPPPKGHQNARRHGVYSKHLTPEEERVYERLVEGYLADLGDLSDEELALVERIAWLETRWKTAAKADAPYRALNHLHKLVWNETETYCILPEVTGERAQAERRKLIEIVYALSQRMYAFIYTPLAVKDMDP